MREMLDDDELKDEGRAAILRELREDDDRASARPRFPCIRC